jgi:FSR family fosmidomycin resistance protein-like MFS transporter
MSSITYLPMLLQGQGIQLKSGSLILTTYLACGAVAGLYGGHLSDKIGRKRVIMGAFLVYPILAALMLLTEGPWLWVFAGASGAALLASNSVTIVLTQELLPHYLGLASGVIMGLGFGTGGLGTALSGYLADMFGLYITFWILAVAPFLSVGLAMLIKIPAELKAADG